MGVTGAGKSTFIKNATGCEHVSIGDSLTSGMLRETRPDTTRDMETHLRTETSEVSAFEFVNGFTRYILIDTPGFDDTDRPDNEITAVILNWLKASFDVDTKLNGVVYLHRIIDPRMSGTALRNNRMFRRLVGEHAFKNVILATTFWEQAPKDVASQREAELRNTGNFWGGMVSKGSQMARLMNNRKSCLQILERISREKVVLEAQVEMNLKGKSIHNTAAAQEINREREQMVKAFENRRAQEEKKFTEEMRRKTMEHVARIKWEKEQAEVRYQEARAAEIARQELERIQARERYDNEQRWLRMRLEEEERRRQREAEALARQIQEEKERQAARQQEMIKEFQRNYRCIGYTPQWMCHRC
ncbi:P-loop containing nucleoside triphosphate hydrolase protein [Trichoderma barbatum]